jgi:hypothetical protein
MHMNWLGVVIATVAGTAVAGVWYESFSPPRGGT